MPLTNLVSIANHPRRLAKLVRTLSKLLEVPGSYRAMPFVDIS